MVAIDTVSSPLYTASGGQPINNAFGEVRFGSLGLGAWLRYIPKKGWVKLMGTRKKGFTLIELLVVIAIIAILAAILFPIFMRVQDTARASKCLNNAKQICGAAMMYEGDYNGMMLQGFNTGTWGDWYSLINPYLRQMNIKNGGFDLRGVWMCPNIPKSIVTQAGEGGTVGQEISTNVKRCYGYNTYYLGGVLIPGSNPPKYDCHSSSEVVKSTKTIRIMEVWGWHHRNAATKGWGTAYCYPPVKMGGLSVPNVCWPPGWHNGRSTVGWCDGHVSAVKTAPVDSPTSGAYFGVMAKYLNGNTNAPDPYFRLLNPKP